jgi:hypothetical protein
LFTHSKQYQEKVLATFDRALLPGSTDQESNP